MKLLIDENLLKRLKANFSAHEIHTVSDMGWNDKKNGDLLKLMLREKFIALLTFDKKLQYQQNFIKYPTTVFVLNAEDNTYLPLKALVPIIHEKLNKNLKSGPIEIKARI